jgi:peptidylprolyl isomerase
VAQRAKNGDTVSVHYKGSLDDGSVFDSSEGQDPIEFTIGEHQVIEGLENAIVGMTPGDKKREAISPAEGYGDREEDLVFQVPKSSLQAAADFTVGDVVRVTLPDGQTAPMQIVTTDDSSLTLDANHPLAGKTLTFDLELVSIKP